MSYNGIEVVHVVAMDQNNCIGKQGKLPWHIKEDLQRFKDMTDGGIVVMGRKTYESIGQPLKNRVNIVVSRTASFIDQGISAQKTIKAALKLAIMQAKKLNQDKIFIIGGAEIYAQTMDIVDRIELTRIKTFVKDGDAFYPEIDCSNEGGIFALIDESLIRFNRFNYNFVTYARKLNTTVGKDDGEWCVLDRQGEIVYHGSSHDDAKLWFDKNAGLGHRYILEELPAVERQKVIDKALAKQATDAMGDDVATFAVGDLVVLNIGRKIYRVDHIYQTGVWLDSGKESCNVVGIRDVLRHATPEEEAAGHRIDETEEELLAEAEAWRECREPCRFDQLEVEPTNGWAVNNNTAFGKNAICPPDATHWRNNVDTPIFYKIANTSIERYIKYNDSWVNANIGNWVEFCAENNVQEISKLIIIGEESGQITKEHIPFFRSLVHRQSSKTCKHPLFERGLAVDNIQQCFECGESIKSGTYEVVDIEFNSLDKKHCSPSCPYFGQPHLHADVKAEDADGIKQKLTHSMANTSVASLKQKHSHYHKDVSRLKTIDVYRLIDLYAVTDPCLQHALKKILCAGVRGAKDQGKDIQEAIDTLTRWQEMQAENEAMANG